VPSLQVNLYQNANGIIQHMRENNLRIHMAPQEISKRQINFEPREQNWGTIMIDFKTQ
jgi:hypothetical protein